MKPVFFATQTDLRNWFKKNHKKEKELLVGFYKVSTGKMSVTWPQSVDQAICFGWIDGIRRSINEESYSIRFTPRRPKSTWSAINIKKVKELTKLGLMQSAGIAAFEKRNEVDSKIYGYEKKHAELPANFKREFTLNKEAWRFYKSQPPYYRRATVRWIMSAKLGATKIKRLRTLINDSAAGQKVKG